MMLNGKTAVVTGGSRGIGRAIAYRLAKAGADIAVIYSGNELAAQETVDLLKKIGVSAKSYKCDISDYSETEKTVKKITEELGDIDILVNNAGITKDKLILQMSESDFDSVVDTNLKGTFNMIKHCYRGFMKQRSGKIINISSVSGLMGNAGQANYSSSKAGIVGLTKTVARELAGRGICCNAIAPGFIETDMTKEFSKREEILDKIPMKRMGRTEEVAELAAFLAEADYITGEVIRIDGGIAM